VIETGGVRFSPSAGALWMARTTSIPDTTRLCLGHPGTEGIRFRAPGPSKNGRHVNSDPANEECFIRRAQHGG